MVDFFPNGLESLLEQLLGPQGNLPLGGNQLAQHIQDPHQPQQMQHGKMGEEAHTVQNIKG